MTDTTCTAVPVLPLDLAPALATRVLQLLAEVETTSAPPLVVDVADGGPRCVVCHAGGKLGGHHASDGRVEWIHKKCHRRLHRRGRANGHVTTSHRGTGQRVLQRRHTAC